MKHSGLIIVFLFFVFSNLFGQQCQQVNANQLLPIQKFLSLAKGVEKSEEVLLPMNFCFTGKDTNDNGISFYSYHLDHTANANTQRYQFDHYAIAKIPASKKINSFSYITSSSKNYLDYKNKLINYGFKKVKEDNYVMKNFGAIFSRMVSEDGSPNYKILINETIVE